MGIYIGECACYSSSFPAHKIRQASSQESGLYCHHWWTGSQRRLGVPAPHLIQGELKAELAGVESVRIPGYWMEKEGSYIPAGAPPIEGEIVLMHLHGGGYAVLSAHPFSGPSATPSGILKQVKGIKHTFNLEYRLTKPLATAPENPFPAALLDAIAGYNYLVNEVGFAPENIIIEGDSSGANLALALVRYLIERQGKSDTPLIGPRPTLALDRPQHPWPQS